ncbi:ubiquitin-associated protein 2- hypothetical protein [Limosa lapponica baueri]|uniref:UBA domain-containing protein n=1 Tax=Limosa lapponica baueri TaxID=1758121 RepID=A0A2I0TTA6_LIMLA|nr:ubiquitin-associated protein 2- hypothetical protein [Limosa lapponica baueri]
MKEFSNRSQYRFPHQDLIKEWWVARNWFYGYKAPEHHESMFKLKHLIATLIVEYPLLESLHREFVVKAGRVQDFLFCTYIVLYILYMMTSVGSERTRGTRDKMQISTTQPTPPQKQVVQATAEQIRLAQMIYDKNDADFEDKVKQLMEVTGKNQDESIVALHDCNGDVNRAINILLEGNSDTPIVKRQQRGENVDIAGLA